MPAAVPNYLGNDFKTAAPGHRFRLYYAGWLTRSVLERRIRKLKDAAQASHQEPNKLKRKIEALEKRLKEAEDFRERDDEENLEHLRDVATQSQSSREVAEKLRERQRAITARLPEGTWLRMSVQTTSPIAIGTGVEHPIENGLLFYDPHGLPYVPGSTLKGVLRRAAEELALFEADRKGWTLGLVWYFFGFDGAASCMRSREEDRAWRDAYAAHLDGDDLATFKWVGELPQVKERLRRTGRDLRSFLKELGGDSREAKLDRDAIRVRGAIECWDAFFVPPRLRVDIMNPHLSDYYQGGGTPHETGSPTPIYFLAVDAGVDLELIVTSSERGDPGLRPPVSDWKSLIRAALDHVGSNLGIGAKTSVGYGRFQPPAAPATSSVGASPAGRPPASATAARTEVWESTVTYDPGKKTLSARRGQDTAMADQKRTTQVLEAAPGEIRERLLKKKRECRARVTVRIEGNQRTIEKLEELEEGT